MMRRAKGKMMGMDSTEGGANMGEVVEVFREAWIMVFKILLNAQFS